MKEIRNTTFPQERALYGEEDLSLIVKGQKLNFEIN